MSVVELHICCRELMVVVEHAVMVGSISWVVVYLMLSVTVVVLGHSELVELILVHVLLLQLYLYVSLAVPVTRTSISALRTIMGLLHMIFLKLQFVVLHSQLIVHTVDKINV